MRTCDEQKMSAEMATIRECFSVKDADRHAVSDELLQFVLNNASSVTGAEAREYLMDNCMSDLFSSDLFTQKALVDMAGRTAGLRVLRRTIDADPTTAHVAADIVERRMRMLQVIERARRSPASPSRRRTCPPCCRSRGRRRATIARMRRRARSARR